MTLGNDLRNVPLFKDLEDLHYALLESACSPRSCERNQVIFEEGKEGDELYLVRSGKVAIGMDTGDGYCEEFCHVRDNEVFGEFALLDGNKRSARARAVVPTELLVFAKNDIFEVMRNKPEMGFVIMCNLSTILSTKIRDTNFAVRNVMRQQRQVFNLIT